ncbi:MAG: aminopeptidase P family protein [Methanomassiliicoccales archaeon]|nr:MAG: aminopeptidase P family protein [Methanomassiliicoccales archaeon]
MKHTRTEKILENCGELDAIVFINGTEPCLDMGFFYVTELVEGLFEGGLAIVYPDGSLEVVTSLLEAESAKKGDFEISVFKTKAERKEITKEKISKFKKIGINAQGLLHKNYLDLKELFPDIEFVDISESVSKARMIKDDKEIDTLKSACKMVSEVAEDIVDFIKEGILEYEVAAELSYMMQKKGAVGPSFDTISSFGKNTAEPHYTAGDAVLKKGEFVLLDFGAKYRRYCSDITRTFVCGGGSDKHKDMYETILKAQKLALDKIKPGVNGKDVHQAVSDFIEGTKYKGLFTHSTGHSIGLSVHDGPAVTKEVDVILEENMVFTVEPGIYISGYGGVRIEDDVRVTKDGVEILTWGTKELIEV